ncbi:LacI family DNA-binding transcriptional regulator [Streptomyces sp. NPDC102381]|uniref:LacI family DNA-binding transcriptional regulator n=1 Tax=Streptomyces sp. NPDC102381 TaxID=3366164 RepID=UPI00381C4E80
MREKAPAQWGLVTNAQAKQCGVQGVQLLRLERAGSLRSVEHGVYLLTEAPTPEHLRIKVAWLRLEPGASPVQRRDTPASGVVSHRSACELLGLGGRDLPPGPVELTLPVRRTTRDKGVRLHRLPLGAKDVTVRDGLPVTTAGRTVVDLLRAGAEADHVGRVRAEAVDQGLAEVEELAARMVPFLSKCGPPGTECGEDLLRSLYEHGARRWPFTPGRPAQGDTVEPKRATVREVARSAGVSHQTVSRYLRGDDGMKPLTRERIGQAAAALNYRPSAAAWSMRTRRSDRIAIVLPELTEFAPIPMLRGASAAAHEAGFTTDVVGLAGGEQRRAEGVFALLDSGQVDGVLCLAPLSGLSGVSEDLGRRVNASYGSRSCREVGVRVPRTHDGVSPVDGACPGHLRLGRRRHS